MGEIFGKTIAGTVDRLVRWVVIPTTRMIPVLVSKGLLLILFAALWAAFGATLVTNQAALDDAWRSIQQMPLPVQGVAWLLFMPLLAGAWVWETDWSIAIRVVLVTGIAGWNVLVFMPRRPKIHRAAIQS